MADPIKPVQVGDRTRYRFVVDIGRDPITGKRQQKTMTFDRKKDAVAERARIMHEVNQGTFVGPSKTTVEDYLAEWLRSATRGKEVATARNYQDALRLPRERLGAVPLQKLTTIHVEDLVDYALTSGRVRGGKVGTGLGPRSVQLMLSRLRSALDDAVHRRLIPFNPAAPVKCPAQTRTERDPWTDVEVRKFLGSLSGHRLEAPMVMAFMGLRPAEVCGLRWSDVDLEAGTLRVSNTRTLVESAVVEKGPKSAAGRRTLPLPPRMVAALTRFKATQAAERLAAGPAYVASGYVLVDEIGEPCRTDWLRRRAYELMAAAGSRKVRLYDARHSVLTYMATHGVPGVIVSAWAGHSDLGMAARVYTHPTAADLEQGRDALAALLG